MAFLYGEGRYKPKIEIKSLTSETIEFYLRDVDLSFANSLRRVIISEVPTFAIDVVSIKENTNPLFDEFIAHRLGLIPLICEDIDKYKLSSKCDCREGCKNCSFYFHIKLDCIENTMEVTSDDIIPKISDCSVKPVKFDKPIIITKLQKGQKIAMDLTATKGMGKMHAKWSPVCTCVMKQVPDVEIIKLEEGENFINTLEPGHKKEFSNSCPSRVFEYDEKEDKINVIQPEKCSYCEECIKKLKDFIKEDDIKHYKEAYKIDSSLKLNKGLSMNYRDFLKVEHKKGEFLFKVESTGSLSPKKIVMEAFNILNQKFDEIDNILTEIENKED